jgi:Ser-tRNA(Ala) deacylase AlaX
LISFSLVFAWKKTQAISWMESGMSVDKVFWQAPYQRELQARVNTVDGNQITLDRTIIFAFSGGQQSDAGTIGGRPVLAAEKRGREIYYTLTNGHGLKAGDGVRLTIDWPLRYRLMKLHFAAELALELVYRNYGHPERIGANITADKARLDFRWEGSIASIIPDLQAQMDRLIAEDHPIRSDFSDPATEQRYWEIEGFARVACGGTHLQRTGEIGPVRLKRDNPGKGKERLEIFLKD